MNSLLGMSTNSDRGNGGYCDEENGKLELETDLNQRVC